MQERDAIWRLVLQINAELLFDKIGKIEESFGKASRTGKASPTSPLEQGTLLLLILIILIQNNLAKTLVIFMGVGGLQI